MICLTRTQAARALLCHQQLWPPRALRGTQGILAYLQRVGSVQFDPVDLVGISPEIVLNARVDGFKRPHLAKLLYKERALYDVWDKNACIAPAADHPLLLDNRRRQDAGWRVRLRGEHDFATHARHVLDRLENEGPLSSHDFRDHPHDREALLRLLEGGEVGIERREGRRRFFYLNRHLLSPAHRDAVIRDEKAHQDFFVLRRIGGIGLLWNRRSDAWLGVRDLSAAQREETFARLEATGHILPVQVAGIRYPLYCRAQDAAILTPPQAPPRACLLAPLDNLLWDRRLIEELFGFSYRWEVYTQPEKRSYGPYTLPVLYADRFVARASLTRQGGSLCLQDWWWEPDVRPTQALRHAVLAALRAHARMLDIPLSSVTLP